MLEITSDKRSLVNRLATTYKQTAMIATNVVFGHLIIALLGGWRVKVLLR